MGWLRKMLKLWLMYARMDLVWISHAPKHFLIYTSSDMVLSIATISGVLLLAERFNGLGPWNKTQVVFMLGYSLIATGALEMFFSFNLLVISRRLGRGQLDHVLIQPQPLWVTFFTEGFLPFSASSILIPGCGLLLWSAARLELAVTPWWIGMLVLNLLSSSAIVLAWSFLTGSLAFWAPRAAEEISSSSLHVVEQLKTFPLDGLSGPLLGGLLTVLPVSFVAWYPCRALLGIDTRTASGYVTPLAALLLGICTTWIFTQGLAYYGRTGSQRYLGFGHRR